jgi:hypothetical protein
MDAINLQPIVLRRAADGDDNRVAAPDTLDG